MLFIRKAIMILIMISYESQSAPSLFNFNWNENRSFVQHWWLLLILRGKEQKKLKCMMLWQNEQHEDQKNQERNFPDTSGANAKTTASKKGLVSWFTHLKEGTLHVEEDHDVRMRHLFPKGHVHFSVTDMVELKWVIEDLNGVSYRKSTLISGFQDLGLGAKQLWLWRLKVIFNFVFWKAVFCNI